MSVYESMLGQTLEYLISGRMAPETGILVDAGDDILVFVQANRYYYVPIRHVQQLRKAAQPGIEAETLADNPIDRMAGETISYRKTLYAARGVFVELHVTGIHSLCGYITGIMNDYIVFYSNVHHTVYISLEHVKYLVPYPASQPPFGTGKEIVTMKPSGLTLARTFEQQIKKMEGSLVILDLGDTAGKIGLLQSIEQGTLTLVSPDGETIVRNIQHVKSAHMP